MSKSTKSKKVSKRTSTPARKATTKLASKPSKPVSTKVAPKAKAKAKVKSAKALPAKTPTKGVTPIVNADEAPRPAAPAMSADSTPPEESAPPAASASMRARVLVLDEADAKKAGAALQKFGATQLQRVFADLFGVETTSRNVTYLRAAIGQGLVDRAAGKALAPLAEERGNNHRKPRDPGGRDPRLPAVNTTLERTYKGATLHVKVLEEGFLYEGTTYPSLSALAKSFTGCSTNGFLWFGLAQRPERAAEEKA